MASSLRPSDIHGPPDSHGRPRHDDALHRDDQRSTPRWPLLAGIVVIGFIVAGLLIAPDDTGEGGVPPAVVDIISEDQAIAALALYRAQTETRDELMVDRSLYAPPGPGVVLQVAERAGPLVVERLNEARSMPEADAAVVRYWSSAEHDAWLVELRQAERDIGDINLLALIHDSLYGGAASIPFEQAQMELAARYSTGVADRDTPMFAWGRALLAEFDGQDARGQANEARAQADAWWNDRAATLQPAAVEPLRAYIGGLPPPTIRGLEGHPLAGPGLDLLRRG